MSKPMPHIIMYSSRSCGYCMAAERLLRAKGVTKIDKILVDADPDQLEIMIQKTNRRTVPQIFINDQHIGGFDDLSALDKTGGLDGLLGG